MAMIKCCECGKEMSSFANSCPNCGCPTEINMRYNSDFLTNVDVYGKEFCPICGQEITPFYGNQSYTDDNGTRHIKYLCKFCHSWAIPLSSLKDYQDVLKNPMFDKEKYEHSLSIALYINDNDKKENDAPKCPTCGSTNIEKISTLSKTAGAYMFGLLSKTARSQFKCKNCGYKW